MRIFPLTLILLLLISVKNISGQSKCVKDVLGVTHVSGKYNFTSKPFLQEGVDTIQYLGTSIVKLWLTTSYKIGYSFNTDWSLANVGPIKSMTDLIKTPYYQTVLNRPKIKTIIFVASEFFWKKDSSWKDGVSIPEHDSIVKEFTDLTIYLRTNPNLKGKTVVLQNWEGDNALNFDKDGARQSYQDSCIAGMIDWLKARQEGINAGRDSTPTAPGDDSVVVAGAAEFNQIPGNGRTFPYKLGIDYVVPNLKMDLYSWSNYTGSAPGEEWKIIDCLDYIRSKADTSVLFGRDNIMMGEFGCAANRRTGDRLAKDIAQREVIGRQVELALKWGIRYMVLWEIYCNGWVKDNIVQPVPREKLIDSLDGFWLIRPDSVYTQTWYQFRNIMSDSLDDYKTIYQAENQPRVTSPGDPVQLLSHYQANGYYYHKFKANAVNDFISYKLYIPKPGIYHVRISMKKNDTCGQFQLYVDNQAVSGVKDAYASTPSSLYFNFGNVTFNTKGDKVFKFVVTGKNASSVGYDVVIDAFRLEETGLPLPSPVSFTPGNIVVSQLGDGDPVSLHTSAPAFLKEFSPTGTLTNTVAMPSSSSVERLTLSDSAFGLSLTPSRDKIVIGGYDVDAAIPSVDSATNVYRTINTVSINSEVKNIAKAPANKFLGYGFKGVVSNDTSSWGTGKGNVNNWGIIYTNGDTIVRISNAIQSTRMPVIHAGQLYLSTGQGQSGQAGIYKVGTGLPVISGRTVTLIINTTGTGIGTGSPYGFVFHPNGDTCYIADDRTVTNGGGIQKWKKSGTSWALMYTLSPATASQDVGARGIAVDFSQQSPVIYATTADGGSNRLIKIVDTGALSQAALISAAATNTYYNGVCLSPGSNAFALGSFMNNKPVFIDTSVPSLIKVYPNSTTGRFIVSFPTPLNRSTAYVIDISGRIIQRKEINGPQASFDLSGAPPGIYFVRVQQAGGKFITQKVIKK